jgi:hypothetical protein
MQSNRKETILWSRGLHFHSWALFSVLIIWFPSAGAFQHGRLVYRNGNISDNAILCEWLCASFDGLRCWSFPAITIPQETSEYDFKFDKIFTENIGLSSNT